MKHTLCKHILPILLVVVFLLTGCAQSQGNFNTEVVVARVGDIEITRNQFRTAFDQSFLSLLPTYIESANPVESIQNDVFSSLLSDALLQLKFEEFGMTFSEEDETVIADTVQTLVEQAMTTAREKATEEGAADIETRAGEIALEELQKQGFTTIAEYEAYVDEAIHHDLREARLYDMVTKDITLSEADAKALFEKDVVTQKLEYNSNPSVYEAALNAYESGNAPLPPLYTPDGMGYVKHILVEDEALAQELYARVQQGEDFDKLIAEYGIDPGLKEEPAKTRGYLFYYGVDFVDEFIEGVFTLENEGDYTEPIKSDHGYHIILLDKYVAPNTVSWEEVSDVYADAKIASVKAQAFADQVTAWRKDVTIDSYISRIRDIGVSN